MAEAIARHEAPDVIEAASAGFVPLGFIAKRTISTLAESGIPCGGQTSKGITREAVDASDLIVNMCGRPLPPLARGHARVEDWDVDDPYGEDAAIYRRICKDIRHCVKDLAQRIKAELKEETGKTEI